MDTDPYPKEIKTDADAKQSLRLHPRIFRSTVEDASTEAGRTMIQSDLQRANHEIMKSKAAMKDLTKILEKLKDAKGVIASRMEKERSDCDTFVQKEHQLLEEQKA